ncbi:hypothetical protein [Falsibacillus albus]|uniref:Uncharacterized protein n=1 Tax=Falsibacillus albus TaxID=2478915 RepID=A0A3L7JV68_9BACI|nr:hypothetical protein [Falsibacillus albus]RLQ92312.1 hypothetical protein D9X91_19760 [Falsibacillus albus]
MDNYYDCGCDGGYYQHKGKDEDRIVTCNCCVTGLEKAILNNFKCGDSIGITFFGEMSAAIYVGRFRGLKNSVLEVEDLLVPGTTSLVPLCDIDSIERGIPLQEQPLQIKLG